MPKGKLLVTGAAGFIGMDLCVAAAESGYEVVGIDAFRGGLYSEEVKLERAKRLFSRYQIRVENVDLSESQLTIDGDITHIIHAAAMPGLSYSFTNPAQYVRDNELGTLNLLRHLGEDWQGRFVHVSTSSVYGEFAEKDEYAPTNPISPYGLTKLASERYVELLSPARMSHSIVRLYSVYGPGQRPDMGYFRFIQSAIANDQIVIFGDGSQSRSNTYITDAVAGILGVLERGRHGETYNIGGGEEVPLLDAINLIYALAKTKPNIVFRDPRIGDQQRTHAVINKAKNELGYLPKTTFDEGIRAQFDWQKSSSLITG